MYRPRPEVNVYMGGGYGYYRPYGYGFYGPRYFAPVAYNPMGAVVGLIVFLVLILLVLAALGAI